MTKFQMFLNEMRGKRVAVLGIGVSNRPLISLLLRAGAVITACDRKEEDALGDIAQELKRDGVAMKLGDGYLKDLDCDVIFRTPGMRPDVPELAEAVKKGAKLTSEMEVFFSVCPCQIIGITGSDGKTTTTTLIYEMLTRAGYTCHLGGNIGHPLLANAENMKADDIAVVELSSFQLMTMQCSPHIAVVTNISPNHLDVHKSYQEYMEAKKNIFAHQTNNDILVLNADNETTPAFKNDAKARVLTFSSKGAIARGMYLEGDSVYSNISGSLQKVMERGDIRIPGKHNVENFMAAMCAVYGMVDKKIAVDTAREFSGVAHRIEFIREVDGVKYYNDSIASSPTRTIAGLNSFDDKVILIVGGKDKKIPFDELAKMIVQNTKGLILMGRADDENRACDKIRACIESLPGYKGDIKMESCFSMEEAVLKASQMAKAGDTVLLSPACTSFDMFKNFEHRGDVFRECVKAL